jgi:hypothetical protein
MKDENGNDDSNQKYFVEVLLLIKPYPIIMKMASKGRPNGYSGMTAPPVTVRGSLTMANWVQGKLVQVCNTTQYEPGLSEEVGIFWEKSLLTSVVVADEDIVLPPLPHMPALRETFKVVSQSSVPVTVTLDVPA